MSKKSIFYEIEAERARQDIKWGGSQHDDAHTQTEWISYIIKHIGKSIVWPYDSNKFRRGMIVVAALAVAAIESLDRTKSIIRLYL